eukprot:13611773-Heterocapsa_arctica.AAC.1
MRQVDFHELAALHLLMKSLAKHFNRKLDLHARNNLSPKEKERRDRMVAMPLELRQILDPVGEIHLR